MGLTNLPQPNQTPIEAAVLTIRQRVAAQVSHTQVTLATVRNLARKYGRAAIAAELGEDAAALLTWFTKTKEAVEAAAGVTEDDLPT